MSKILWKKVVLPGADAPVRTLRDENLGMTIENVKSHPWTNAEIPIPDPKAFRSMSRAALLLSHVCMDAREALRPYLERSPFSVGVYAAVENGPIDVESTVQIIRNEGTMGFPGAYRKFRNPKMYLKQLPNLASAQIGISLGLQGPMNVYTHSSAGGLQALEQAEWDLKTGVVDAALVCTAHAFDDFIVVKRTRRKDIRCLAEGAAALVLVAGSFKDWSRERNSDEKHYFGISDPIINLFKESYHAG